MIREVGEVKTRIYGTFGGTFREGKDYSNIDYHIKEIAKIMTDWRFTVTCETEPLPVQKEKKS